MTDLHYKTGRRRIPGSIAAGFESSANATAWERRCIRLLLNQGVAVRLPEATNSVDKPTTQDNTVIAISKDGSVYLNAKPVSEAELTTKINEALENKKEKTVFINADEEAAYSAIMATMDQLRQAGVEDIGLITTHKKAAAGGQ